MRHKVSELEGARLAAAVAKAQGLEWRFCSGMNLLPVGAEDGESVAAWVDGILPFYELDWPTVGPIIEREQITVSPCYVYETPEGKFADQWEGSLRNSGDFDHYGPTPLIAATRAYVASKFGDEVDIP